MMEENVIGNTDYVKFLNFLNQLQIKYESNFRDKIKDSEGEYIWHFTNKNGEKLYEYWEIELTDSVMTYGCCVFVFDKDQKYVGVMAE